jgi:EpsI family protein
MNKSKLLIVITLLSLTLIGSYAMPRAQYVGTGFISSLDIPLSISDWVGRDVKDRLNLDFDKDWNKFISEATIHEYANRKGNNLVFIMMDAGNFHHPNVCFTSAGYEIKELGDTEFSIQDRSFKAHTLFTTKGAESNLSFYWIVIDQKIAHKWIEQKIKQLYFSLFNRKRVGLMVRVDIPTKEDNIKNSLLLAKEFITELSSSLPPGKLDYIFGKQ